MTQTVTLRRRFPTFFRMAGPFLWLAASRRRMVRAALVLLLAVVMCVASAWMAVGKVKKVDPADVF